MATACTASGAAGMTETTEFNACGNERQAQSGAGFGRHEQGNRLMAYMQRDKVGYLAVSLGYFKTLFSSPGSSTSSEIPEAERAAAGLSPGLIRFSVGLDEDITTTLHRIERCLHEAGVVPRAMAGSRS